MAQPNEWNGMILHLFRQVDSSVYSSEGIREQSGGRIHTYTAFGNYDRLCFTPVCRFVDYMKRSENAYRWIGGHKDIMLYPVKGSGTEGHFSFAQKGGKQKNLIMKKGNQRRFLIMTMLFLSSEVKDRLMGYQRLLKACDVKIGRLIAEFNTAVGYSEEQTVFGELYGTFNSAEMCILWGANQFTDVQYLVDQIRYLSIKEQDEESIPLFASTYTIISMYQNISEIQAQGPVNGGAMIQLASASLRHSASIEPQKTPFEYLSELKQDDDAYEIYSVEACSGEYDFLLNTRPPGLALFDKTKKQNLYYSNQDFKAHFSSSTTRLYYNDQDIPECVETAFMNVDRKIEVKELLRKRKESTVADHLLFARTEYDKYDTLLANSIGDASSLSTNYRLFYSDYMRAVHMTPDWQWTQDLQYQVKTAVEALTAIALIPAGNDGEKEKLWVDRQYIEWTEKLLQSLRHQIRHITEAGKFTFEEPSLRATSTVEYDLLFHMFYGAAKEILNCIYDRNQGRAPARQTPLVPVIKFRPTPAIESELWFEDSSVKNRLLDITIPYDAWGEPQFFIPYLVHEFYHYVAPVDRDVRNEYFSQFLLSEIYRNAVRYYLFAEYKAYCKWVKKEDETLTTADLERLTTDFADELQKQIFKIIVNEGVLIRSRMEEDYRMIGKDLTQKDLLSVIAQGDADWNTYKEALLFWCTGSDGETLEECNCFGFFRKVIAEAISAIKKDSVDYPSGVTTAFCDMLAVAIGLDTEWDNAKAAEKLVQYAENQTANVLELLENSLEWLRADPSAKAKKSKVLEHSDFDDDVYPIASKLAKQLREEAERSIGQAARGLREIFPDYAMVTLCGLGVKEYLLLCAVFQDKFFSTPDQYANDDDSTLRVGCILDQLLRKSMEKGSTASERLERLREFRDGFKELYKGYYRCCGWADTDKRKEEEYISKAANAWFDVFEMRFSDYSSRYQTYEALFERIFSDCFKPLCPQREARKLNCITKSFFTKLTGNGLKRLFSSSLSAISLLQPQRNLCEMAPNDCVGTPVFIPSVIPKPWTLDRKRQYITRWVRQAESMQSMLQSINADLQDIHQKYFSMKFRTNDLWYRGIWNCEFGIIPSALVHLLDQDLRPDRTSDWKKGENAWGALWDYQNWLLQKYKYQADGSGELINNTGYAMPDYLALMQHYKQYTCYLDWSEDAFSSLFFALERYVMQEKLEKGEEETHASLFVLDPMLYNRARSIMVKDVIGGLENSPLKDQNNRILEEPEGSIPDISLKWNLEKFSMFTMEDPSFFQKMKGRTAFVKSSKPLDKKKPEHATLEDFEEEILNLPLAVHTSRLNPRIRKQSGQFMVYSHLCRPAYQEGETENPNEYVRSADRFDYLSLQRVQDYFLRKYPKEYPFMYELRIHCDAKASLAAFLRSAGINRYGIYPELDNLKL